MNSVWDKCLYVLYPKRCALCGEVIELDGVLCNECMNTERITGKICRKCGREVADCCCKKEKFSPGYKAFCAPYYFDGSMRVGIYRLKNSGYTQLAQGMATEIADTVRRRFPDVTFDAVTFVPMRRLRQHKRGYNQSALLAEAVAEHLGIPCEAYLKKVKHTFSQRLLSSERRKLNLYGSFAVTDRQAIAGKTILLVDDVKTTGYTLSECAVTLNAAGVGAVYATAFTLTAKK
ncbi:MAG: ComF family protein [Eubacterium sp.]|nr:ComF family protein [Eubacterium sp.]